MGRRQQPGKDDPAFAKLDFKRIRSFKTGFAVLLRLIPTGTDQNPCAQSRIPIEMMIHGCSTSLFQAWQQWARISS